MSEKPILFNSEMVRAILDGKKTQTRRVIKPQPRPAHKSLTLELKGDELWWSGAIKPFAKCPRGEVGDLLWVRETQWINGGYVATDKPNFANEGKIPSIFMKRDDSRLTLRVTDVRVERVQSITPSAAIEEGVIEWAISSDFSWNKSDKAYPLFAFQHLWDSIFAKRGFGWDVNPWVWCVEFECVGDPPDGPR